MIIIVVHRFDQSVDVMLSTMVGYGYFEYKCDAEQSFLRVTVADHLKDREVLQNGVHHVLFRQILQFVDEVYHVFTHWRPDNSEKIAAIYRFRMLHLQKEEDA